MSESIREIHDASSQSCSFLLCQETKCPGITPVRKVASISWIIIRPFDQVHRSRKVQGTRAPPKFHRTVGKVPLLQLIDLSLLFTRVPLA